MFKLTSGGRPKFWPARRSSGRPRHLCYLFLVVDRDLSSRSSGYLVARQQPLRVAKARKRHSFDGGRRMPCSDSWKLVSRPCQTCQSKITASRIDIRSSERKGVVDHHEP